MGLNKFKGTIWPYQLQNVPTILETMCFEMEFKGGRRGGILDMSAESSRHRGQPRREDAHSYSEWTYSESNISVPPGQCTNHRVTTVANLGLL